MRRLLEEKLSRPVHLDNDVNALATAEMLFGWGKDARNFAVVTVGRGIGAGLVVNGEIYRGASGGAGELGHTVSEAGDGFVSAASEVALKPTLLNLLCWLRPKNASLSLTATASKSLSCSRPPREATRVSGRY